MLDLIKHQRTGETYMAQNQYICEVCEATFDSEAALEEHRRNMHPQYGCTICGETFRSERELDIHYHVEHPEHTPPQ